MRVTEPAQFELFLVIMYANKAVQIRKLHIKADAFVYRFVFSNKNAKKKQRNAIRNVEAQISKHRLDIIILFYVNMWFTMFRLY